jgi:hypothetical protein
MTGEQSKIKVINKELLKLHGDLIKDNHRKSRVKTFNIQGTSKITL